MRKINSAKAVKQFERVIKRSADAEKERKAKNIAGVFVTSEDGRVWLNVMDGYMAYRINAIGDYIPQENLDAMPKVNPDDKVLKHLSEIYYDLGCCDKALDAPKPKALRDAIRELRGKVKEQAGNMAEVRLEVGVDGTDGKVIVEAVNGEAINPMKYVFGSELGVNMVALNTQYLLEALELFNNPEIRCAGSPISPVFIYDESYDGECFIMPIRINK